MTWDGSGPVSGGVRGRSGDRSPFTPDNLAAGAQSVDERATHQRPDRPAQPGHVVHRLVEGQPDVAVAVVGLDAEPDAVAVQPQGADPAAAQRRRQIR